MPSFKTWLMMILAAMCLAFGMAVSIGRSHAHEFWVDGKRVDPVTRNLCCGENDCKEVSRDLVRVEPGGYRLTDTGEFIEHSRVQPSPDGAFWRCIWAARRSVSSGRSTAPNPSH